VSLAFLLQPAPHAPARAVLAPAQVWGCDRPRSPTALTARSAAVDSALQRAPCIPAAHTRRPPRRSASTVDGAETVGSGANIAAHEAADVDALAACSPTGGASDAAAAWWLPGRDACSPSFRRGWCSETGAVNWRLVPGRANGSHGGRLSESFGETDYRSFGCVVLGLSGVRDLEITVFA